LDHVEDALQNIIDNFEISKRMKSIVEILFYKRKNGWKDSFMKGEGPKKIKDIRDGHRKEQ